MRDGDGVYFTSIQPYTDMTASGARIPYDAARMATATDRFPPALSPAMQILSPVVPRRTQNKKADILSHNYQSYPRVKTGPHPTTL